MKIKNKSKPLKTPIIVLAILLAAFTLTACNADTAALTVPTQTPIPPTPTPEPTAETPEEAQIEATEPAVVEDAPPPTPTADGTIPMPELGFAPGDPALKASDLSGFVKASGQPQIVELFAFW